MEYIENNNLLKILDLIENYKGKTPQKCLEILYTELSFSSVICPFVDENNIQIMCHQSNVDEFFISAFSNLDKFIEFFGYDNFMPRETYMPNLIHSLSDDLTGIMINPSTDEFFIDKELLENVKYIEFPDSDFRDIDKSQFEELLETKLDLSDIKYNEFNITNDNYSSADFTEFLKRLKDSFLWILYTTPEKLRGKPKKNIYPSSRLKEIAHYALSHHDDNRLLCFSDVKSAFREHTHKTVNQKFFIMPMSFCDIVEIALKQDFASIIINHSTNPIFLHRDLLIKELDNIIKYSHNPDIHSYRKYAKLIK